ncbi:MAG: sodium-dependent bicarbonate transport family permease [Bacteroidetes bacterium]|nr:sodium-dependent bicarbonate transport family permease [Bacteroidota bacterium]
MRELLTDGFIEKEIFPTVPPRTATEPTFFRMCYVHNSGSHGPSIMALMESPAIIVSVLLMMRYEKPESGGSSLRDIVGHSFTNGSVVMPLLYTVVLATQL